MVFKIMDNEITELARQLGKVLKQHGMKIVTAESCTGGGIAQAITEIPGSSAWFDRGFVTYSNAAKLQMLQVKQSTLDKFGAVSEQVAIEMAEGALKNSDADLAVSVTGIAGPDGGSEQKSVGTIYIAWKKEENNVVCILQEFSGDRAQVREQTVKQVLTLCLKFCFP
jgi:nicotinamide-nucleotide amidase